MSATDRDPAPGRLCSEALPECVRWEGAPTPERLKALPGCAAVLLFVDEHDSPVQLLTTQQLKRLAISRLADPERARRPGRADLAAVVRGVRWRRIHCPLEGRWWYYRLARTLHPDDYRTRVGFGPAWFLWLDQRRAVPELRATERIWTLPGDFVGPWPTQKACRAALEGLIDLFELCRDPQQIRRAPAGQRCSYADMGRCDAPCDGSAPLEAYIERTRSAWRFACGAAGDWIEPARERMRRAAADQRYERAALLKQQIDFAQRWIEQWAGAVRAAAQMNYLLVIPATRRKARKLFLFRRGHLADGPLLPAAKVAAQARAWVEEQLADPPPALDAELRMEQTWLVAHFLQHREARGALIEHLPDEQLAPDFEARLQAAETSGDRHDAS